LPDEFGLRQKPFFFLTKAYWFPPTPSNSEPRDLQSWLDSVSTRYTQKSTPKPKKHKHRFSISNTFKRRRQIIPTPSPTESEKLHPDIEVSQLRALAHDLSTPAALRVVHLRKQFPPSFIAVQDSNFVMHQGELLAVLGANGSGKSTTCHILCGITPATAGDALVDDSLSLLSSHGGFVGWCPQHDILFDELTPLEHVQLYAAIRGVTYEEALVVGEERLKRVRLWHRKDGRVGAFSGGMRRRLSMVLSTIGDPKLVILDEVTTGLDPVSTRDCWNFIEYFKKGRLIMLVTHSMEEAEYFYIRILC